MKSTLTTLIACFALVLTACAAVDEPTPTPTPATPTPTPADTPEPGTPTPTPEPTPTPTPDAAFEDPQTCENPELGFTVSYPGDWWANERVEDPAGTIEPCTFFAPEPLELQPGTDDLSGVAVQFSLTDAGIDRGGEVLSTGEVTVDGRDATAQEREPDAMAPWIEEGSRVYEYLVPLGDGNQLVASTDDIWHDQYDETRDVLDAMMETIDIEDR